MTSGGPMGSTTVIVYYLYERAFEFQEMGYASVVAWLLFIIVFPLAIWQFRYVSRAAGGLGCSYGDI
jgi:multiple sugar transport system permease protein